MTYRLYCGSVSIDIEAGSPADAVDRVKDRQSFRGWPRPLSFDVHEITGYDRDRFQRQGRRNRRLSEKEQRWCGAVTKYVDTIEVT